MNQFQAWVEKYISPFMGALGSNRYLLAIRDGVVAALPLIIVGSFFLIAAFPPLPPSWPLCQFLKSHAETILLPYRMTMFIMALYVVFSMGYSLARSYKLDGLSGAILSVMAFMLTIKPITDSSSNAVHTVNFLLPMKPLGSAGLFVGIIVTCIAINIFRLTNNSKFKIVMPHAVPPSVAQSFEALTPTLLVVFFFGSITYFAGFDWSGAIETAVRPLISATDTLPGVLVLTFLYCFFWFFGIHGASVVGPLARPLWLMLLETNASAAAAGISTNNLPAISAEPFYQWFIFIGGAGSTIGLAILLVCSCKSQYARDLGKIGILPAIFNINEPLVFGAPIVLNVTLFIPFIITPLVSAAIAWYATSWGFVGHVVISAPWTLPGPIGAFLATGGDIRAVILCGGLIILSCLIYYPFVRRWDQQCLARECENKNA